MSGEMLGRIQCFEEDPRCGATEGGSNRIYWVIIPLHPPLEKGEKDIKEEAMETVIPAPYQVRAKLQRESRLAPLKQRHRFLLSQE